MWVPQVAGYAAASVALLLTVGWLATATGRAARRRLRRLHGSSGRSPSDDGSRATPSPLSPPSPPSRPGAPDEAGWPAGRVGVGGTTGGWRRPGRVRLAAASVGVSAAVLVDGWFGCVAGVVLAVGMDRSVRRLEPAEARRRRRREAADLPLAADLIAAGLQAGAPIDRAVTAVAEAIGGPLAERIHRVGRTLRLGGEPEEAWAHLDRVEGGERVARAAIRSSASGASLAGTLFRIADDLRADRAIAAEAAVRRSGVLIVLPLGLCFLPAFILAGLVPVIVAVLGGVL